MIRINWNFIAMLGSKNEIEGWINFLDQNIFTKLYIVVIRNIAELNQEVLIYLYFSLQGYENALQHKTTAVRWQMLRFLCRYCIIHPYVNKLFTQNNPSLLIWLKTIAQYRWKRGIKKFILLHLLNTPEAYFAQIKLCQLLGPLRIVSSWDQVTIIVHR